jgi:hypothetical protein
MSHNKPFSRREFLAQSVIRGGGILAMPSLYAMLAAKRAYGSNPSCSTNFVSSGMTPFICMDLAGGGGFAGSNVMVGGAGGQMDYLAAYDRLGLPSTMWPQLAGQVDTTLGLAFHSDSGLLRGIKSVASAATMSKVDGFVICNQSGDDSNQNPYNPMYWIAAAGLNGALTTQIGATTALSGGHSINPAASMNPMYAS